jgi:hypothetical protein
MGNGNMNIIKSKLKCEKGAVLLDFLIALPFIMMLLVVFIGTSLEISDKAGVVESFRIGLDKMEENGGLDTSVRSLIYNELVSIGAEPSSIVISGTPAHQQHGTLMTLNVSYNLVVRDYDPSGGGYTETVKPYSKSRVCYSRYVVR